MSSSLCYESKTPMEECIMSGGNDQLSYTKNSTYQGRVIEVTRPLINEAISEKFLAECLLSGRTICIADLGCSIGPNTFISMQNIIDSITSMYKSIHGQNKATPFTFQVFFSDHPSNDFNTLFKSLPLDRQYHASGVPGSFYGRLFPLASLHFVHSSFALHWLSKLPEELMDKNSLAWNKGRIDYTNAREEVAEAYASQRRKDLDCFLLARAEELVPQGLMMIVVPARPNGVSHSHILFNILNDILGSCLMEMAKRGIVREESVNSCNLPMYVASIEEIEEAIKRNGSFSIEKMQILPSVSTTDAGLSPQGTSSGIRAIMEGIIKEHFGFEILDELFELYTKKLEENYHNIVSAKVCNLVLMLKRNS
ncbi:hypothetical protein Leryth_021929 [Lithospermum erythrorhizon]|nr:hypothetical protein Leryth_021929 [Lithospermum erythrorhizon]